MLNWSAEKMTIDLINWLRCGLILDSNGTIPLLGLRIKIYIDSCLGNCMINFRTTRFRLWKNRMYYCKAFEARTFISYLIIAIQTYKKLSHFRTVDTLGVEQIKLWAYGYCMETGLASIYDEN